MKHVILLLHGIRDFGGQWMGPAKAILEANGTRGDVEVVPVRFGYYDILSFLAPWDRTAKPYQTLLTAYEAAVEGREAQVRVSVIAHSFGTYLIGRLLKDNRTVRLHRVLLCGSVLKKEYDWHNLVDRFDDGDIARRDRVRNECGNKDPWPIFAKVANGRYGDAGRHGFDNEVCSQTRHYNGGHSLFFEEMHIRNAWADYLISGKDPPGNASAPGATLIERIATWPFVTLFLRWVIIFPLWLLLFFWWAAAPLVGILLAFLLIPPNVDSGREINLANYITHIRENSETQNEEVFERFTDSLSAAGRARVNFTGAIIDIEAVQDAADGSRSIVLLPADCEWVKSGSDGILVQFAEEDLPPGIDFTALAPSGKHYRMVHIVADIENVLWFGTDGRIFASGIQLEVIGDLSCPETD